MAKAQTVVISYEDGSRAVELARDAVESYVLNGSRERPGCMRDAFYQRTGVLVRLESTRGRGQLRGCAGYVDGDDQLGHAIVDAAIDAASEGSCGSEVGPSELSNLRVSVCIICDRFESSDPASDLELGVHGAAIEGDGRREWLYPSVPVENGWSVEEYLGRTCRKLKLPPMAWENGDADVTLFEGRMFREREPEGVVEQLSPGE